MKDKFILLTTDEDTPVIIGVSNISIIEPDSDSENTRIVFNFARNKDLWPKVINVKENFDKIKSMIGLWELNDTAANKGS